MGKFMLLVLVLLVHESTQQSGTGSTNNTVGEDFGVAGPISIDNGLAPISPHCGDCSDVKRKIYKNTGYICHKEDKSALVKNFNQQSSLYPECVPRIYEVVQPIKHYCCFWSPEMGCSIIVGQKHYKIYKSRCTPCHTYCESASNGAGKTNYGCLAPIPLALLFLA